MWSIPILKEVIPTRISTDLFALVSARGVGGAATRKQKRIPSRSRRTKESELLRDGIISASKHRTGAKPTQLRSNMRVGMEADTNV